MGRIVGGPVYHSQVSIFDSDPTIATASPIISSMHYHNTEYMLTPGESGKFVCIFMNFVYKYIKKCIFIQKLSTYPHLF